MKPIVALCLSTLALTTAATGAQAQSGEIRLAQGYDQYGDVAEVYVDESGRRVVIDSTGRIAEFFGLTDQARASKKPPKARGAAPLSGVGASGRPTQKLERIDLPDEFLPEKPHGVQAVIEKALRSAGLM